MKKTIIALIVACCMASVPTFAKRVTLLADQLPAAEVFREIVEQTGKNFVYSSELLDTIKVSVNLHNATLGNALKQIFHNTSIIYQIKGNNVILTAAPTESKACLPQSDDAGYGALSIAPPPNLLEEVVVVSRLEEDPVKTAELGARKVTASEIVATPVLFGEPDVIKALQMQPGVAEGTEGLAGMHVHGGGADENLYMLDNVPLYHVNHFAGLFSAFNTDIIRYIDFFKTSMPAKFDGRLSSFMDVRLKNGNPDGHHGSARLGLTSGAFNLWGPMGKKTTYLVGLRRSWLDLLTLPALAIINSTLEDEKMGFNYNFTDLNAKVSHTFSPRLNAFVSIYFGDDHLKANSKFKNDSDSPWDEKYTTGMNWGNLVAQVGAGYRFSDALTSEFTAAYTRYFSSMNNYVYDAFSYDFVREDTKKTRNYISDWIFRGDFKWQPAEAHNVRFGAGYTRHSFLPSSSSSSYVYNGQKIASRDSTWTYGANEANAYIEDDWHVSQAVRANAGVHLSLFNIDGRVRQGISPRLSLAWHPREQWAFKSSYSRTVQYVHKLSTSYLSLPTDQWIPITGSFKPQTADKIAAGVYWQSPSGVVNVSVEGYYKWMHNLVEYADEYYLKPPMEMWNSRLTAGRGTARGIDFKVEKTVGKVTGFVGYSLAWADRTFRDKNGGKTYPARFDNRHTINVVVSWKMSPKVELNAAWTGHSGNRFTLLSQMWESGPFQGLDGYEYYSENALKSSLNNYQLPFNHRLDLSCRVNNSRGYWSFGLYNAYNHRNVIAVRRGNRRFLETNPNGQSYWTSKRVFQKISLLPILPSISYTWIF